MTLIETLQTIDIDLIERIEHQEGQALVFWRSGTVMKIDYSTCNEEEGQEIEGALIWLEQEIGCGVEDLVCKTCGLRWTFDWERAK